MDISPISSGSPITRLHGSTAAPSSNGSQDVSQNSDSVEISDNARYLAEIKNLPDIRQGKVDAARAAIAAGVYETPHRLDVTVNRLLEDLK